MLTRAFKLHIMQLNVEGLSAAKCSIIQLLGGKHQDGGTISGDRVHGLPSTRDNEHSATCASVQGVPSQGILDSRATCGTSHTHQLAAMTKPATRRKRRRAALTDATAALAAATNTPPQDSGGKTEGSTATISSPPQVWHGVLQPWLGLLPLVGLKLTTGWTSPSLLPLKRHPRKRKQWTRSLDFQSIVYHKSSSADTQRPRDASYHWIFC